MKQFIKDNRTFLIVAFTITLLSLFKGGAARAESVSFSCTINGGLIQCGRGWSGLVYGDFADLYYANSRSGAKLHLWFWAPEYANGQITYAVSDKTIQLTCFRNGNFMNCSE